MGSKIFDGVRFSAYPLDHDPPHLHAIYAGVKVILDLLPDQRDLVLSNRRDRIKPGSAKASHVAHVLRTGANILMRCIPMAQYAGVNGVRILTTEADIEAYLELHKDDPEEPSAVAAEYIRSLDLVYIKVDNGRRLFIPREELQGLENATPDQLANIQIFGFTDIAWPDLDVDHYLPHLMEGKYATEKWLAARTSPTPRPLAQEPVAA